MRFVLLLILGLCWISPMSALTLRENLNRAKVGDFVVTAQQKNYTFLRIYNRDDQNVIIEEITVPAGRIPQNTSWREWVAQGAPYHTSWVLYTIQSSTGQLLGCYSLSQKGKVYVEQAECIFSTLFNLPLSPMPENERRRVGTPSLFGTDTRPFWQPQMVVNGAVIPGVSFDAWWVRWPVDEGPFSGRIIELYLPSAGASYSSYFPYWIQVKDMGKTTIRVIDSGSEAPLR